MNCPICSVPLQMSERQGVEIDYCPKCRGVWLDRGELDKIIERSAAETYAAAAPQERYDKHSDKERHHEYKYKKRKSFLSELFD